MQTEDEVNMAMLDNGVDDRSQNEGDAEMVQLNLENQEKLFSMMP